MKDNYQKPFPKKILLRAAAVIPFAAVAVFICLLAAGVVSVHLPWRDGGDATHTKTPGELAYEEYLRSLTTAPDGTRRPSDSTGTSKPGDDTSSPVTPDEPVSYPTLAELISEGYRLTYSSFTEGMRFAEITPDGVELPGVRNFGTEKTVTVLVPSRLEEGGQLYESYEEQTVPRAAVELYMGYIMIDCNDGNIMLFNSDGSPIAVFPAADVVPAYARDISDRPLFTKDGKYYYLDADTKEMTETEFDPAYDGRGLSFDYAPNFGKHPDERFGVLYQTEPVTLTYYLDRSSYYTRYKVDPRIARALYELDPGYAELVAIQQRSGHYYNYPFKVALDRVKEEIAREQEEAATATEPVTEPEPEPVTEPVTEPATDPAVDPSAARAADPTVDPVTDPATDPVTDPVTEPVTDPVTDAPTETTSPEETTAPEETTSPEETTEPPYDPVLEVSTTFYAPRFYYGSSLENIRLDIGCARAYAFSEGFACIVDDYGVLKIISTSGRVTAQLNRTYLTDAGHGSTYMNRKYYRPFYNDIYHLGYYYFDHGLMRVRVIEHERLEGDIVNYITADDDILIDPYGNEFKIPAGYKLVSYSDGILLLERDGKYGYYHRGGYWIAQPVYTYAMPFVEGIGIIGDADGFKGAVDTAGNTVIPFAYTDITTPSSGIIACYSESTGWKLLAKVEK